jgi:hypothetical protein
MVTDDPIGRMFKRGQLRLATDQDGKTAKTRLRAARMWQSIYADLPGAQLNPDKRKAAQAMSELQDQLGAGGEPNDRSNVSAPSKARARCLATMVLLTRSSDFGTPLVAAICELVKLIAVPGLRMIQRPVRVAAILRQHEVAELPRGENLRQASPRRQHRAAAGAGRRIATKAGSGNWE